VSKQSQRYQDHIIHSDFRRGNSNHASKVAGQSMFFPLAQLMQLCLYRITYFCTVLATEAVSSCSDLFAGGETELGHWSCRETPNEAKPHEAVLCRGWMAGLGSILSNPPGYFSAVIHAQSSNMEKISRRRGCIFLVSHNLLLFVTIYSVIFLKSSSLRSILALYYPCRIELPL